MSSILHYIGCLLMTVFLHEQVTSVPWRECQPIIYKSGLNILNCSQTDLIQIPDPLSDIAEVLDFSKNRLVELPFLPESTLCDEKAKCHVINNTENHCRYDVSFSRNEIYKFHPHALHSLRCLRSLDLSYNSIKSDILHPISFQEGLHNLEVLLLRGNPLRTLPDNVITAVFLLKLRHLDLSGCGLEEIGENSVDDHPKLETLYLKDNKLTEIKHATFKGLTNLRILDLRRNKLEKMGHQVFGDLTSLDYLLLSQNRIQSFARHAFYGDSKLKFLDVSSNKLSQIPYEALQELAHMTDLRISANPMTTLSSSNTSIVLSSVTTLEVGRMPNLKELGSRSLAAFPSLTILSIRNNDNLESIHRDFLPLKAPRLKEVYMEFNKLTTLHVDALPLKQLTFLSLRGNRWFCDYRIEWMIRAEIIKPNTVKCDGPTDLKGRDIKSLDPRQLQREFPLTAMIGVVAAALSIPLMSVFIYLVWKRKHHCCSCCTGVRGRYVTVYTRDMDGDDDDQVDIERANLERLNAVSNGDADDTRPFISIELPSPQENDKEGV